MLVLRARRSIAPVICKNDQWHQEPASSLLFRNKVPERSQFVWFCNECSLLGIRRKSAICTAQYGTVLQRLSGQCYSGVETTRGPDTNRCTSKTTCSGVRVFVRSLREWYPRGGIASVPEYTKTSKCGKTNSEDPLRKQSTGREGRFTRAAPRTWQRVVIVTPLCCRHRTLEPSEG